MKLILLLNLHRMLTLNHKYINYKNKEIDISKLDDKKLVHLYKWFQKHCKIILNISTYIKCDNQWQRYEADILSLKDKLYHEIRNRGLKLIHFQD